MVLDITNLNHNFSETGLSPSSRKNLFSWAQSIKLPPISGGGGDKSSLRNAAFQLKKKKKL